MKNNYTIALILLLTSSIALFTACSRDEDPDLVRKEVITRMLNDDIKCDSLEAYVAWMQGMGTRFALADNHRDIAVKIRDMFIRVGYDNARLDSFMIDKTYRDVHYIQWQFNVIATLEGTGFSDSVCIVGGHYDNILKTGDPFSVVPGANDNASGIAAALEIARVMKKNRFTPYNTIEFVAFGAEELGLYGSKAYAMNSLLESKKIMLMINNDMIAYQPGSNKSEWTVNIIDYENSIDLRKNAEQICNRFSFLNYINDNTFNKQSDSYPFFTYGFKAIFFFSNVIDPAYHSLNDKVENCNFEYCREIVKINCALLVDNN